MRSWLINSDCLDQSVACDEPLAATFSVVLFAHSLFTMVLCQIRKIILPGIDIVHLILS